MIQGKKLQFGSREPTNATCLSLKSFINNIVFENNGFSRISEDYRTRNLTVT